MKRTGRGALAGRQVAAHAAAPGAGHRVQLARQSAAAATQDLQPVFLSVPKAYYWTRTVVESTSCGCKASSCSTDASARAPRPEAVQHIKRVYIVCQLPHAAGKAH